MGVFPAPSSGGGVPSGPAGGVLGGTYPNPAFAIDMATQAELDAVAAVKANLASPTFTGDPKAPTAAPGDSDTSIATTAFVAAAIIAAGGGGGAPSGPAGGVLGGTYPNPAFAVDMATQAELDAVVASIVATYAPLASPALTGNPTVPTQSPGTNSTRAASTAYTDAAVSTEAIARAAADATLAPLNILINAQVANYQVVTGDNSKLVLMTSASALTLTIPSGTMPVGSTFQVTRGGTGTVTLVASGVTLNSKGGALAIAAQWTSVSVTCTATNVFLVEGNL